MERFPRIIFPVLHSPVNSSFRVNVRTPVRSFLISPKNKNTLEKVGVKFPLSLLPLFSTRSRAFFILNFAKTHQFLTNINSVCHFVIFDIWKKVGVDLEFRDAILTSWKKVGVVNGIVSSFINYIFFLVNKYKLTTLYHVPQFE